MAQKRPDLSAIGNAAGSVHALRTMPVSPAPETPAKAKATAKTREGTKQVAAHYPPAVNQQLKIMAAEMNRYMDDLLAEALNDLFAKYNKPEIAPRKAKTEGA